MSVGSGKYDHLCTYVREQAHAEGAIVVIFKGDQGPGFSVQCIPEHALTIADLLEYMAKQIRADFFPSH